MPHRSRIHYNHSDNSAHAPNTRAQAATAQVGADYTLVHAGRQLRLGPIAFWVVVGTLVIMAAWTITTATYFAFREDVLTRLITRQAEMQFGYEDRIAELRAQVDRVSSRQLLDQEQYEHKLDQVLRRQAALESRAAALNALPDAAATGSIRPPARSEPARAGSNKPSPINDTGTQAAPADRDARLESRFSAARLALKNGGGVDGMLARLTASLDRVEARQAAALSS